jgi:hypothetical protein
LIGGFDVKWKINKNGIFDEVDGFRLYEYVNYREIIGGPITSVAHKIILFRMVDIENEIFKVDISGKGWVTLDNITKIDINYDGPTKNELIPITKSFEILSIIEEFLSKPYEKCFEIAVGVYRRKDKAVGLALCERVIKRMKEEMDHG